MSVGEQAPRLVLDTNCIIGLEEGRPDAIHVRAVRGVTKPQKSDGIYRAMRAGRSTHMRARAESIAAVLHARNMRVEPGKNRILDTRRDVIRHWLGVQEALRAEGRAGLADEVERFIAGMPPPRTEREWMALALTERMGGSPATAVACPNEVIRSQ
ncbi:MAG: hypothetical protein AB7T20_03570 [Steroidobacteraceae bacterium]